ncbi:L-fucose:H+ symporter permease [Commensalibacter oyaizuii]|uniref:L-fucose:H+ symporter permease n=1 Tax=Commensalibacter oyaizuii TaxID=3043873 RepID=A0ABT6Q3Z9_9PROT|nr:L-fucose:H+ symporter permease [Commensalibacter sp. TBRC 16381]MDI2091750.1 L-fucose:H+ symporter permease [Commensalibacter sp. TBRC 16381]
MNKNIKQFSDGYLQTTPKFQFFLLCLIFTLIGAPVSLNDILITQFKSVFNLSDFSSVLIQSVYYGGYFLIAIPASLIIKRTSYKITILIGLLIYSIGCLLFYPASSLATYTVFLAAIMIMAFGLSILETTSTTYSAMLGPHDYTTLRLNISQIFLPIGSIIGIFMGKYLIFQEGKSLKSQAVSLSPEQYNDFQLQQLLYTLQPYKYIVIALAIIFIFILITSYPDCKPTNKITHVAERPTLIQTLRYLIKNKSFCSGVFTQFIYAGMQASVWSFTIRLALELGEVNEREASNFMLYSCTCFFIGKFIANIFISRFPPKLVLFVYSVLGTFTLLYITFSSSFWGVYAAIFSSILMGPCWPTIFADNLEAVEKRYIETAGAITVMSIVGGAVIPAIQGFASDVLHSMHEAFIVPSCCFMIIALYFFREYSKEKTNLP